MVDALIGAHEGTGQYMKPAMANGCLSVYTRERCCVVVPPPTADNVSGIRDTKPQLMSSGIVWSLVNSSAVGGCRRTRRSESECQKVEWHSVPARNAKPQIFLIGHGGDPCMANGCGGLGAVTTRPGAPPAGNKRHTRLSVAAMILCVLEHPSRKLSWVLWAQHSTAIPTPTHLGGGGGGPGGGPGGGGGGSREEDVCAYSRSGAMVLLSAQDIGSHNRSCQSRGMGSNRYCNFRRRASTSFPRS